MKHYEAECEHIFAVPGVLLLVTMVTLLPLPKVRSFGYLVNGSLLTSERAMLPGHHYLTSSNTSLEAFANPTRLLGELTLTLKSYQAKAKRNGT